MRPVFTWNLGTRSLELGKRTLVMGIVNVTPDSFSDGGQHFVPDAAPSADRPSSNDVTIDSRGLIYLVDRVNGVDIIEADAF